MRKGILRSFCPFQSESVAVLEPHFRLRRGRADGQRGGRVLALLQGVPAVPLPHENEGQVQVGRSVGRLVPRTS